MQKRSYKIKTLLNEHNALDITASAIMISENDLSSAMKAAVDTYIEGYNEFEEMLYILMQIHKNWE